MLILCDHGTPSGYCRVSFRSRDRRGERARGWDRISNGELLKQAQTAAFDLLLTTDKRIQYQQNLTGRKLPSSYLETHNGGSYDCILTGLPLR
jgi:hypothetical protein